MFKRQFVFTGTTRKKVLPDLKTISVTYLKTGKLSLKICCWQCIGTQGHLSVESRLLTTALLHYYLHQRKILMLL